MAETKGISINFYGNTLDFDKSLDSVNKALKLTKQELSNVNKSLKFEPGNVDEITRKMELLKQKQSLLTEGIEMYKKRLAELGNYSDLTTKQKKEYESTAKALGEAELELRKLNKELSQMPTANVQALAKKLDEVGGKLEKVGNKVQAVGKKLLGLTASITGLAAVGIKYNATLEQQEALFTTLTGSAEEAKKVLDGIKQDALKSPFDTESLISANQYLIATGLEADKSRQVISNLGDAIAATGGGNSELQRMAQNLQQIQNVGKASSQDMKQFAMAGIDIWGILAETTGKTVTELQQMDITFDMIADALANASGEGGKYAGAMEKQSETLNGKINKLKATFQELLGELTVVLMPIIKQVIDLMQKWIEKLRSLDDNQKKSIVKVGGIVAAIGPLLMVIGKVITVIGFLATKVAAILSSTAVTGFISSVTAAGGGLSGMITVLGEKLAFLANPVTAVIAIFALLYAKFEEFRNAVNGAVEQIANALLPILQSLIPPIKKIIDSIKNLVTTVVKALTPAIKTIVSILSKIISVIGTLAAKIISLLGPVITTLINIFATLISTIANVISWLVSKLGPAFNLLGTVLGTVFNIVGKVANALGTVLAGAFKIISGVVNTVKGVFEAIYNTLGKLFERFSNSSFGQKFIGMFEKIGGVVNKVKEGFSALTGWLDKILHKTDTVIGKQQIIATTSGKSSSYDLVNSGGLGMNVNINVTNNGTPIDVGVINSWADTIAARVDYVLGRNLT